MSDHASAVSIDGRTFEFEAPIADLLPLGGYAELQSPGSRYLRQAIAVKPDFSGDGAGRTAMVLDSLRCRSRRLRISGTPKWAMPMVFQRCTSTGTRDLASRSTFRQLDGLPSISEFAFWLRDRPGICISVSSGSIRSG